MMFVLDFKFVDRPFEAGPIFGFHSVGARRRQHLRPRVQKTVT